MLDVANEKNQTISICEEPDTRSFRWRKAAPAFSLLTRLVTLSSSSGNAILLEI